MLRVTFHEEQALFPFLQVTLPRETKLNRRMMNPFIYDDS